MEDTRFQAAVLFQTVNCAMAGAADTFKDMLNILDMDYEEDIHKKLDEAKLNGLNIEDR